MIDPIILILTSLATGEKHGYAIMQDIENFSGARLGPGTLYGAITRMEERGLIRPVKSSDRRQPYLNTSLGQKKLAQAVQDLNQFVRAAAERLRTA